MKPPPYLWLSLLGLFLLLPLLSQVFTIAVFIGAALATGVSGIREDIALIISIAVSGSAFLFLCFLSGMRVVRRYVRKAAEDNPDAADTPRFPGDERFVVRYLPVLIAFGYTLTIAGIALAQPVPLQSAIFGPAVNIMTLAHLPGSIVLLIGTMFGVPSFWTFAVPPLAIYAAFGFGLAAGFRKHRFPRTSPFGATLAVGIIVATVGVLVWRTTAMKHAVILGDPTAWYAEQTFNRNNTPFMTDNALVKIPAPTLTITENHPKLDGATATFPIYAAASQAIYKDFPTNSVHGWITSSTTPTAYERLISGYVDVAFVAQPSAEQRALAESRGVALHFTPIAKEAFVFFVHADNPVSGLTSEQIRAIYAKRIVNWNEVGGLDEKIIPFQRPPGSGSQTALELKVMQGEKPAPPLREEIAEGMGGVIQRVAAYQNSRQAIGYSFRVYATTMNRDKDVKFLAIDGVEPTRENIRSGSYPYTADVFAATAGTTNLHVPAFIDWFLTDQGQQLVEDTGYVSLRATSP